MAAKTKRIRGASGLRFFLGLVLALVLIVLVVGIWRNWFEFAMTSDDAQDRTDVQVSVNRDRIREDTAEVVGETRELAQSAFIAAEMESVEGTIVAIDPDDQQITLRTEDEEEVAMVINKAVEIEREAAADEALNLDALQEGDRVLVSYHDGEKGKQVMKITLLDDAAP